MHPRLRGLELGVLLTTCASIAFAQTALPPTNNAVAPAPSSEGPPAGAPANATLPEADHAATLEAARELFWKAHSYFEKGEYVEALRLFEQTYALMQEPEVLFNLALTHQRLGHCDQARALYQEYQSRVRADVTKQLGELEQRCPLPAPPAEPTESVPAPLSITVVQTRESPAAPSPAAPMAADATDPEPFPLKTVGWVALGAAAVALGAAVYFEVERQQYRSDFEDLSNDPDDPSQPGDAGDQLDDLEADHDRARTLAVTMGVVSGALAVGGVTLLVLAPNTPAHSAAEPGRQLGLGLRWSGSF